MKSLVRSVLAVVTLLTALAIVGCGSDAKKEEALPTCQNAGNGVDTISYSIDLFATGTTIQTEGSQGLDPNLGPGICKPLMSAGSTAGTLFVNMWTSSGTPRVEIFIGTPASPGPHTIGNPSVSFRYNYAAPNFTSCFASGGTVSITNVGVDLQPAAPLTGTFSVASWSTAGPTCPTSLPFTGSFSVMRDSSY